MVGVSRRFVIITVALKNTVAFGNKATPSFHFTPYNIIQHGASYRIYRPPFTFLKFCTKVFSCIFESTCTRTYRARLSDDRYNKVEKMRPDKKLAPAIVKQARSAASLIEQLGNVVPREMWNAAITKYVGVCVVVA